MMLLTAEVYSKKGNSFKTICGFNELPTFERFINILQNDHQIGLPESQFTELYTNRTCEIRWMGTNDYCRFKLEFIKLH